MIDLKLLTTKLILLTTAVSLILVGLALKEPDLLKSFSTFTLNELEQFLTTYGDFPVPWV